MPKAYATQAHAETADRMFALHARLQRTSYRVLTLRCYVADRSASECMVSYIEKAKSQPYFGLRFFTVTISGHRGIVGIGEEGIFLFDYQLVCLIILSVIDGVEELGTQHYVCRRGVCASEAHRIHNGGERRHRTDSGVRCVQHICRELACGPDCWLFCPLGCCTGFPTPFLVFSWDAQPLGAPPRSLPDRKHFHLPDLKARRFGAVPLSRASQLLSAYESRYRILCVSCGSNVIIITVAGNAACRFILSCVARHLLRSTATQSCTRCACAMAGWTTRVLRYLQTHSIWPRRMGVWRSASAVV